MDAQKLAILHEHYRDTCTVMQSQRHARDRYFYFVIVVVAIAWFDLAAPEGFANAVGDVLKDRFGLTAVPDLEYVRSVLWFLLLGLTVRYCQAALGLERQYTYVHELEATLAKHVEGRFGREGEAYLSDYPMFLNWAHHLYSLVFPVVLAAVAVAWTYHQIPDHSRWSFAVWFNCTVTLALLVSLGLYLHAFYTRDDRRSAGGEQSPSEPDDLEPCARA